MIKALTFVILFIFSSNVFGFTPNKAKIVMVADSEFSYQRGLDAKRSFMATPPFNALEGLEVVVIKTEKSNLKCNNGAKETPRALTCDPIASYQSAASENPDYVIVLSEGTIGASGSITSVGMIGALSTSEKNITLHTTMIHELLHMRGWRDEYQMSESEAAVYCNESRLKRDLPSSNMCWIEPVPPYAGDSMARSKHSSQIPWYPMIKSPVLITSGSELGTPSEFIGKIGLYYSDSCEKFKGKKWTLWKPGGEKSIMESTDYGVPPNQYLLVAASFGLKYNPDKNKSQTTTNGQTGTIE